MSADLILWLLLVVSLLTGLIAAAMKGPSKAVARSIPGVALFFIGALAISVNGLWIAYSIAVNDWRFAAIALGGFLIQFAASLGDKR